VKRGDIPGDGSGGTGALSDAAAAAPTMGRERAATARLIGEHIELIEADVMELARLAASSNAGGISRDRGCAGPPPNVPLSGATKKMSMPKRPALPIRNHEDHQV